MKKLFFAITLSVLMLASGSKVAFADGDSGDKLLFNIGAKAWANTWTTGNFNESSTVGSNIVTFDSTSTVALIPSLSLKYGNWALSTGYMPETSYTFTDYSDAYPGTSASPVRFMNTAKRSELDTNVAYYIIPNLAVSVGYKQVVQKYTNTYKIGAVVSTPSSSTTTMGGLTFGLMGSAAIAGQWNIYGNFAYGAMDVSYSPTFTSPSADTATYYSSELGLAYKLSDFGAAFTFGYRSQIIDTKVGLSAGTTMAPDVTKGFILGANLFF